MRDGRRRWAWVLTGALLALGGLPWLLARWVLRRSAPFAQYDQPPPPLAKDPDEVGPEVEQVVADLREAQASFTSSDRDERRTQVRRWLDEMGAQVEHDCDVVPVDSNGCRGDWIVPPDADPACRLLYLHGGAFEAGSPRSHRSLTTRIAERTGMPVLVPDYRLSPEHNRVDALDDVDAAWELVSAEGPQGPAPLRHGFVAGDSAGGNLALGLAHRLRDRSARQPDAVVVFSPLTDSTLSSPSITENVDTDPFLGPGFARLLEVPAEVVVLGTWASIRIRPDDPRVSPLLDDLTGLPPTLVQVSDCEMLRDDAVRYARAARTAGSPVRLQVWPRMVHVWQAFAELPEAEEALDEVVAFLEEHTRSGRASSEHASS